MKEIKTIIYEAEDGTVFDTMAECVNYESRIKWRPEAMDILQRLKTICNQNTCASCPFFDTKEEHCFFSKSLVPCNFKIDIKKGEFL